MSLSQAEIYTLALRAGLTPDRAKIAAAVAMAESGGNPNAYNGAGADDSYGLWQINMKGALQAPRIRLFRITSNLDLFDPKVNARAMAIVSERGATWSPWTTYTSGRYRQYLDKPVSDTGGGGGGGGVLELPQQLSNAADSARSALELATKGAQWVSNSANLVRVAYVVGGGVLVIVATVAIIRSTSGGQVAERTAKTVGRGTARVVAGVASRGSSEVAGKVAKVAKKAAGRKGR